MRLFGYGWQALPLPLLLSLPLLAMSPGASSQEESVNSDLQACNDSSLGYQERSSACLRAARGMASSYPAPGEGTLLHQIDEGMQRIQRDDDNQPDTSTGGDSGMQQVQQQIQQQIQQGNSNSSGASTGGGSSTQSQDDSDSQ